jgi:hypothetical protein
VSPDPVQDSPSTEFSAVFLVSRIINRVPSSVRSSSCPASFTEYRAQCVLPCVQCHSSSTEFSAWDKDRTLPCVNPHKNTLAEFNSKLKTTSTGVSPPHPSSSSFFIAFLRTEKNIFVYNLINLVSMLLKFKLHSWFAYFRGKISDSQISFRALIILIGVSWFS